MNKLFTIVLISMIIFLSAFICAGAEDETAAPAFMISEVTPSVSVKIDTTDFPHDMIYAVFMSDTKTVEDYIYINKFYIPKTGSRQVIIDIPDQLKSANEISLQLRDADGKVMADSFTNIEEHEPELKVVPVSMEVGEITLKNRTIRVEAEIEDDAEATEEEPAVVPAKACNYSVFPYLDIEAVEKGKTVTVTTRQFGAGDTYDVRMSGDSGRWYDVSTYETGDGSPQTLTLDIPTEISGSDVIYLRFLDQSLCGIYAANFFTNVTVK